MTRCRSPLASYVLLTSLLKYASASWQKQQQDTPPSFPTTTTSSSSPIQVSNFDSHNNNNNNNDCHKPPIPQNEFFHKQVYTVGVHAIRGLEAAFAETNATFGTYLSQTAGQRFDPPIQFRVKPLYFDEIFKAIDADELDFLYSNPGVYSCIGTEVGATALVTAIKRLSVRDKTFDLDVYGGVIAVRADNNDIHHMSDLKDKVIGAGAIIDLMAGQMQIYEMGLAGLSYVNDPKQFVFTKNQFDVVNGVLDGTFDVGFVRTGQIEVTKDHNGTLIDGDLFRIIEPKIYVMQNDDIFPFLHSTTIFPEWPLASLTHVTEDVAQEVQEALLKLHHHALVWENLQECADLSGMDNCKTLHPTDLHEDAPCDTNWELAQLAANASEIGHFGGFRTSRSYFELRSMQQKAGFMLQDEERPGRWYCTRPSNLYEGITCPKGFFKRRPIEFKNGCAQVGLESTCNKTGYDCFCKPCVKAFDVDVYPFNASAEDVHSTEYYGESLPGCAKMEICGTVEQGKDITMRIFDNVNRDNAEVQVISHAGKETKELQVNRLSDHGYEFVINDKRVQAQVVDILVNGVPISQSPIRVIVVEYNCAAEHGDKRVVDADGNCVCAPGTYRVGQSCLGAGPFFVMIFALVVVGLAITICVIVGYKKQQSDSVWLVSVDELHFNQPIEVVGSGAFGVVVLGQYRGTKVAVKRVIPAQNAPAKPNNTLSSMDSKGNNRNSNRGSVFKASKRFSQKLKVDPTTFQDEPQGDVEAPAGNKMDGSASVSVSRAHDGDWTNMILGDDNYGSAIKILENATLAGAADNMSISMGRGSGGSSNKRHWLPLFMRWDEHSKLRKEFVSEMRLLSRLRHPCITTVMGAVICPRVDPMLVMEYMEYGSLYDLLRNETMYAGGEIILQIIRDITQGINFLHSSKPPILHGDLKAKNILVDSRFRAKVADFGFSHIKSGMTSKKAKLQGTPVFLAPEYLKRKSSYTTQCDMYSFGMILYEVYARKDPFEGEELQKLLPKICHPRINKRPDMPVSCPPKIADVMKKCWSPNPFFRPAAKDVDYILVEMSAKEAEPLAREAFSENISRKPTSLYDVFPKHIADALNAGKGVEPESHECVTVVFSDIVGFTTISQTFTPMKVSQMLDRLYQAFDSLAKKHSVFKVETIGDAYMGVTNLGNNEFETHAKNACLYALDIVEAASKILVDTDAPEKGTVQIRVGFHSGPVVSNVIGSLNPRYGLFGDTVNTASRMESNSIVGRIHCSQEAADLVMQQAPEIPVTMRGKINVKGKGKMTTYWVGDNKKRLSTIQDHSGCELETDDLLGLSNPDNDVLAVSEPDVLADSSPDVLAESEILADIGHLSEESGGEEELEAKSAVSSIAEADDLHSSSGKTKETKATDWSSMSASQDDATNLNSLSEDPVEHKIDCVSDVLLEHLKDIVASRPVNSKADPTESVMIKALEQYLGSDNTLLTEAAAPIAPPQQVAASGTGHDAKLSFKVQQQLHRFVEVICSKHNPTTKFHNFSHATHVVLATHRLLAQTRDSMDKQTFRLDPLSWFALAMGALIHDVDHRGVPNFCLKKADKELHERYRGRATQEQNSLNVGWETLMSAEFSDLRATIYQTKEELTRFRQLLVRQVIATEIFDPQLVKARLEQWQQAFGEQRPDPGVDVANQQSIAVLELLIQASDTSHLMQSWSIYTKWNANLFQEMYKAYKAGYLPKDPSKGWYEGELKFYDTYIIPLATRLQETKVFGGECLKNAKQNRQKWQENGKALVNGMMVKCQDSGDSDFFPAVEIV